MPYLTALLIVMTETTWTVRYISKENQKWMGLMVQKVLWIRTVRNMLHLMALLTVMAEMTWMVRWNAKLRCYIPWRCWQWWPWRLGRCARLRGRTQKRWVWYTTFDGLAGTDGRDDLNDTPDCEGGTQSWQWWPRWLHQRHWNPRYQPSWPDQILTVHHMPHSMALLTLMAETTWTVCRIARENLKLTVMADTNRRGRNRNPRVSRGSVQSKHAKSTETATIWLTGSNCGRINYSIAWCVRSIVFRWLNTLEIMIRMLTRCGYCGYCEGASIWWWISRFTVMWHGRIVSRVVSKNLWEPNESGASSSPTSGLFGRRAF